MNSRLAMRKGAALAKPSSFRAPSHSSLAVRPAPRVVRREVLARSSIDEDEPTTVEVEMKVEGMMCDGCSGRIEDALKAMGHVKNVSVSLDSKLASVEVQAPSQIDALHMLPTLMQAVKDLGFEVEPHFPYEAPEVEAGSK